MGFIERLRSKWDKKFVEEILVKIDRLKKLFNDSPYSLAMHALAFVIHHQEISVVIPGARNYEQVRNNVKFVDIKITHDQIKAIKEIANG